MAKIFYIGTGEILSLTITSSRIGQQNVIATGRESGDDCARHSGSGRPLRGRDSRWAAMNQSDHRILFSRVDLCRRNQPALDVHPVVRPFDAFGLAPGHWEGGVVFR